jgi:hypothetical protein
MIEIHGNKYGDTSDFAKSWNLSKGTISKYCNEGKIPGAQQIKRRWHIPENAIKPLTESEIKKVLILTLKLKNNPKDKIDFSTIDVKPKDIDIMYKYLENLNYIMPIEGIPTKRLPYDVIVSDKGFILLESSVKQANSKADNTKYIADWVKVILSAASSIVGFVNNFIPE